jgi:hypothetical protein
MRITAVALGLVLGSTVPVVAQEERPGGPHEGIKVHGHWTIDVREPDGRLVSRNEVENALMGNGEGVLAKLLGRRLSTVIWSVKLEAASSSPGPCDNAGQPISCYVAEPSFPRNDPQYSKNLQLRVQNQVALQLSGSTIAVRSTSIGRVSSEVNSTTLDGEEILYSFTAKDLATPVPVAAGQIIQVTVLFSFS